MAGVGGQAAYEAIKARLAAQAAAMGSSDSSASNVFSDNTMKYGAPNAVMYSGLGGNPPERNNGPSGPKSPGEFTLQDYLRSLGLSNADFGMNLPEAPDLTAGVASQYAPVINYLKKSVGRTKNEGEEKGEELKAMYGAMANMSKQSGKTLARQGRVTQRKIGKTYEQAERKRDVEIENDAERVASVAENLGISQSLPASTKGMLKESAHQHRMIARNKAGDLSSAKMATDNWANFAKAGAQGARLEGAEAQATLSQSVADAIFALRGQIAQSKAEKAAAMMQAQQAEYGMSMDAASAQNSAAMQKAGFAQQYQQMMMEQAAQQGGSGAAAQGDQEGWDLVSSILRNEAGQESGINQRDASQALEAFQGFDFAPGYDSYGQPRELSMDQWTDQFRQQAEAAGIDPNLYRSVMLSKIFQQTQGTGGGSY